MGKRVDAMLWLLAVLGSTLAAGSALARTQASAAPPSALDTGIDRCFALRQDDPAEAVRLGDTLLASPGITPEDDIKLQSCVGRAAALLGDDIRAIATVDRIEALLQAHPASPAFSLRALSNAGATLHLIGHLHRAIELYARAYEVAEHDQSPEAQVVMLLNVGSIHSEELEAYAAAEGFYVQAQDIVAAHDLRPPLLHYNRGMNYQRMGRDRDALQALGVAATQAREHGMRVVENRVEAESIAARARLAPDPTATARLRAMSDIQQASGDPSGGAITLVRLSSLALAAGDANMARASAEQAIALVGNGSFRIEHRDAVRARVAALRRLGAFEEALDAQQALLDTELGVLRVQNLQSLAGLQARLHDDHSERQIQQLREASRIEALNLQHTRRLRNAAMAGLVLLALLMIAFAVYQRRINRRLHHLGAIDAMTGLHNRGEATRRLGSIPLPPGTSTQRNVVFLIDVDHFKHSNDRHGHGIGDSILTEIATRLAGCCRPGDLVARWGGEEFLVACPGLEMAAAVDVADRLRRKIAESGFEIPEVGAVPLSISLGFACWPFFGRAGDTAGRWEDAITLADRALYASKRGGRNAWTGLWGNDGAGRTVAEVMRDPEAAVRAGAAIVETSRAPVLWRSDASPGQTPAT